MTLLALLKSYVKFEFKIIDVDTGKELGPQEEDENLIRVPQVCNGYHNLPDQTKELFTDDGWVKTGGAKLFEPHCEKTGLRGFRPGLTQTGLYSHTRWP